MTRGCRREGSISVGVRIVGCMLGSNDGSSSSSGSSNSNSSRREATYKDFLHSHARNNHASLTLDNALAYCQYCVTSGGRQEPGVYLDNILDVMAISRSNCTSPMRWCSVWVAGKEQSILLERLRIVFGT